MWLDVGHAMRFVADPKARWIAGVVLLDDADVAATMPLEVPKPKLTKWCLLLCNCYDCFQFATKFSNRRRRSPWGRETGHVKIYAGAIGDKLSQFAARAASQSFHKNSLQSTKAGSWS